MSAYPILVANWDEKHPPDMAVCLKCDHACRYDPSEGMPDDVMTCPKCGAFDMTSKYDVAPKCKGCGRLGHWGEILAYCCSRKCQLQAEYADSLRSAA